MPELDLNLFLDQDQQQQLPNNPFLNGVAEEDRPIVGKYINDWDKGVQQRFQQIHDEYAPFKGLDPDDVQTALQLKNMLDNEPEFFYETIKNFLAEQGIEVNEQEEIPGSGLPPEYEGLPPALLERLGTVEQALSVFGQSLMDDRQSQQEAAEMAELDSVMDALHNEYGTFDDRWVLSRIAGGQDPESAVQEYAEWVNELVSSHGGRVSAPPIMGGSGQVPSGQVDVSKLSRGQTVDMVAKILQAAAGDQ